MFSLIKNETCSLRKLFTSGGALFNVDRNVFILSMIETSSRGSFSHVENEHVKNLVR